MSAALEKSDIATSLSKQNLREIHANTVPSPKSKRNSPPKKRSSNQEEENDDEEEDGFKFVIEGMGSNSSSAEDDDQGSDEGSDVFPYDDSKYDTKKSPNSKPSSSTAMAVSKGAQVGMRTSGRVSFHDSSTTTLNNASSSSLLHVSHDDLEDSFDSTPEGTPRSKSLSPNTSSKKKTLTPLSQSFRNTSPEEKKKLLKHGGSEMSASFYASPYSTDLGSRSHHQPVGGRELTPTATGSKSMSMSLDHDERVVGPNAISILTKSGSSSFYAPAPFTSPDSTSSSPSTRNSSQHTTSSSSPRGALGSYLSKAASSPRTGGSAQPPSAPAAKVSGSLMSSGRASRAAPGSTATTTTSSSSNRTIYSPISSTPLRGNDTPTSATTNNTASSGGGNSTGASSMSTPFRSFRDDDSLLTSSLSHSKSGSAADFTLFRELPPSSELSPSRSFTFSKESPSPLGSSPSMDNSENRKGIATPDKESFPSDEIAAAVAATMVPTGSSARKEVAGSAIPREDTAQCNHCLRRIIKSELVAHNKTCELRTEHCRY